MENLFIEKLLLHKSNVIDSYTLTIVRRAKKYGRKRLFWKKLASKPPACVFGLGKFSTPYTCLTEESWEMLRE